jgi:hypothetical protein
MPRSFSIFSALLCLLLSGCEFFPGGTIEGQPITIDLFPGTSKGLSLQVDHGRDLKDARLTISGATIADRGAGQFAVTAHPGAETTVSVAIEASSRAHPAIYKGELTLHFAFWQPRWIFPTTINVDAPAADVIPVGPSTPSSDRIAVDDKGIPLVKDELIVILPILTPSTTDLALGGHTIKCSPDTIPIEAQPAENAHQVAAAEGSSERLICDLMGATSKPGIILGSIPETSPIYS